MGAKQLICSVGDALRVFGIGHVLRRARAPYVRIVNYHATPAHLADNFRRQLAFYRDYFDNADPARLDGVLGGSARGAAILLSFDDGERSNYDVAAPLLEEFGFTGWFFVSSGRVRGGMPGGLTADGEADDRYMSHAEMRDLIARGHVVGCHTHSHVRLRDTLGSERFDDEIRQSRARLQAALGDPIVDFCWVGGEEWSYSAPAARMIGDAGFTRAFMTNCQIVRSGTAPLRLQRTNIEAGWPMAQVRFYLSGVMDLSYAPKRRRIARKLQGTPTHA